MNSALQEIYIHRSDDLKLVEHYEKNFQIEQNLVMPYYHFVYYETGSGVQFISTEGSSEPITVLRKGFQSRLDELHQASIDELSFMITAFKLDCMIEEVDLKIPNPATKGENIPDSILELIQQTYGYLIYREQGVNFYQLSTGCDELKASEWLAGARLKKREILDHVQNLRIEGYSSNYIDKLFPPNGGLPYLLKKPLHEAHILFQYIQSNPSTF